MIVGVVLIWAHVRQTRLRIIALAKVALALLLLEK
jgi:hypothetical protein